MRIDLKRIIHEHLVIFSIRTFVFCDYKLVFILTKVQTADDTIELISSLISLSDSASDFENKIIFEMFYR